MRQTDTERLDWLSRHPTKVKNLNSGIRAIDIDKWQPSLREAIDAAMDHMRKDLISKGSKPVW